MKYLHSEAFNKSLRKCLRAKGYFQQDLANELPVHPKVLSRKLSGKGDTHLTVEDVQRILTVLAEWKVITTQDEAIRLLELVELDISIFSEEDWNTAPLSRLSREATDRTHSDETAELRQPDISTNHTTDATQHYPQHNLKPPRTRLIGREKVLEHVRHLLAQDNVQLVTLHGPGGSGKTRIAVQVGKELAEEFAQGVWFVSLAPVRDVALVPQSIMEALHIVSSPMVSPQDALNRYFRHKQLLLILDNFEQVVEAATIVDALLASAPGLKILVTSRKVLSLYGEYEFSVQPLDIPDANAGSDVEKLASYSAIQLFVERAQTVAPDFALTDANAATIAQICARVDGLPLALELAAARIKLLTPEQLLKQLSKARLPILTGNARNLPERQQTLRDTINWSYNLLPPMQQTWFARLGVFSGGWSLEVIEAMKQSFHAPPSDYAQLDEPVPSFALDLHEHLMNNSLLMKLHSDEAARYTLLETLHEYALEQLAASGELESLRDWHASYYVHLAETAEKGLRGADQRIWEASLVAEQDNFRAALEWSCQRASDGSSERFLATETALRLASALQRHWEWQGNYNEGRRWLEAVLALPFTEEMGKNALAAKAKALSQMASLACLQNEQERAFALANESIALWQKLDNAEGLATALLHRGWTAQAVCDNDTAKYVYNWGLDLLSSTGDTCTWLQAQLLLYLAAAEGFTGNFEQMRLYYSQSKTLFEQIGDKIGLADLLKDRGGMAIVEGQYDVAIASILQSIPISYELGYKQFIATGMGSLGFAVGMRGEPDPISASIQACQLWGAADSIQSAIGTSPWLSNFPLAQQLFAQIYDRVDRTSWKVAWRTGKSLNTEQAVEMCLKLSHEQNMSMSNSKTHIDLSSRETPGA